MHELGIAEDILAVTLQVGAGRSVRRVGVRMGVLQRVAPESLEFSFRLVAEGTDAETASLQVTEVPARLHCNSCGADGGMTDGLFLCSTCGSAEIAVSDGDQLLVEEVEVEGTPPLILRRPGAIASAPHSSSAHDHGAEAPTHSH